MHEHNILGIQWNQGNVHVHQYSTETTINVGHSHLVQGTTSAANNTMVHVHYYQGTTTFVGHVHQFSGTTGPPVYMTDGTHLHEFSGTTTFNNGHVHSYSGFTGRNFS
ncbi:YmaF family protein [Paenisporosarcina sp. OV554]|uniref:YmaF family protein n=1 Tax=Paenisporosarcina sp. OV554 TaxID=2135694 RepID=UPI000D366DED|nr:YmaF family protein [Paenisporosarcina sp. OV554]PUB11151.1 YmaF-like protein [Paenisporosarcina sp. OV554]